MKTINPANPPSTTYTPSQKPNVVEDGNIGNMITHVAMYVTI